MVVGMQHQQQQPHASPATVLEDATTPCAVSPRAPGSLALSLTNNAAPQELVDNKCSASTSTIKSEPEVNAVVKSCKSTLQKNDTVKMNEIPKSCAYPPAKSTGRVQLREVNPHLVCVLCHGYFVDATSIAECLHTFCRSCIILFLSAKNCCPKCEVPINSSKPHLSLKPDKTLQDIVYKLVPGLFHAEMKRRNQFYQDYPERDLHLHPEFRGITVDRLVYSPQDNICISLTYYNKSKEKEEWENVASRVSLETVKSSIINSDSDPDDDSPKRYLLCPATVLVMDLKKIIRMKYSLEGKNKVEIFYRRESIPDDYSLMDIAYIYAWKRNSPMQLYYKISIMTTTNEHEGKVEDPVKENKKLTKSSQRTPICNGSDDSKINQNGFIESIKPEPCEVDTEKMKASLLIDNSHPKAVNVDIKTTVQQNLEENDRSTSDTTTESRAISSATTISTNTTTTAVHSTPRISTKLKSTHIDSRKNKQKNTASSSPVATPATLEKRIDVSPIKSYLTISSIMNEIDKSESKKPLPPKSGTRKLPISEPNSVAHNTSNNSVATTKATAVPTLAKVSSSNSSSKVVNSLSSIVKSLTTNASLAIGKENHETTETSKCSTSNATPISKGKAVISTATVTQATPSSSSSEATIDNNSIVTVCSPERIVSVETPLKMSFTKVASTTVTASSPSVKISASVSSADSAATTSNSKIRHLPQLLPASTKSNIPVVSVVSVASSKTLSDSIVASPSTSVPSSVTSVSSASSTNTRLHPATSTPSNNIKFSSSPSSITVSASNKSASTTVKSPSLPPLPPLITLTTTSVHSTLTKVTSSLRKNNNMDTVNSFILSNAKIPSSLEISFAQTKNTTASSPMNNLQKLVQQNFSNSNGVQQTSTSGGLKRSGSSNCEDSPKEKCATLMNKTTKDDKKFLGALPQILPEVSITLNRHPDVTCKRLSPETSYDVSCFKPLPVTVSGIPPLTPINTHTATISAANKNIMKSPVKSLNNKKSINDNKNSQRSVVYSVKNTFSSIPNVRSNDNLKRNGSILESNDVAKRARLENNLLGQECTPQSSLLISDGKEGKKSPSSVKIVASPERKEVGAVQQGLSPLEKKTSENALDLTSPTGKSPTCSNTVVANSENSRVNFKSPEKQKLLPTSLPQMIPATKSKCEMKSSSSASIGKVEQKLLSPISKKIERRPSPITTKDLKPSKTSPIRKGQQISSKQERQLMKMSSMDGNVTRSIANTSAVNSKPAYPSPIMVPNFYADPMTLNLLRQQQWIFNMNCPVPPHPLMNAFVAGKPPTSQDSSSSCSTKK